MAETTTMTTRSIRFDNKLMDNLEDQAKTFGIPFSNFVTMLLRRDMTTRDFNFDSLDNRNLHLPMKPWEAYTPDELDALAQSRLKEVKEGHVLHGSFADTFKKALSDD